MQTFTIILYTRADFLPVKWQNQSLGIVWGRRVLGKSGILKKKKKKLENFNPSSLANSLKVKKKQRMHRFSALGRHL